MNSEFDYSKKICSFALGCLDRNEYFEMLEKMQDKLHFPFQELGEFQNLVALLPTILNIETPKPEVKDKIARKLYRIKDIKRPERKITKETVPSNIHPQNTAQKESQLKENFFELGSLKDKESTLEDIKESEKQENFVHSKEKEFQPVKSITKKIEEDEIPSTKKIDVNLPQTSKEEIEKQEISKKELFTDKQMEEKSISVGQKVNYEIQLENIEQKLLNIERKLVVMSTEMIGKKTSKFSFGQAFILFIFFLLALGGLFYFQNQKVENVSKQLTQQFNFMKDDVNNIINTNKDVYEVLLAQNMKIAFLNSSQNNPSIYGKIFINPASRNGVIQLANLKRLENSKIYRFWIRRNNEWIKNNEFFPIRSVQYFSIYDLPEITNQAQLTFLVTEEETNASSNKPEGNPVLQGVLSY